MLKFEEMCENDFFVIDSNNLHEIKQRLYGFSLQNDDIIRDKEWNEDINLSKRGAYVSVKVDDDKILISQDFNGCYGVYLYRCEDYFAISNSFLKLVEYIKHDNPITLNQEYADAFLFVGLCSSVYRETLINEIEMLPRNYEIIIDKQTKSIKFNEIDYMEHSIDLDSKEGIKILDKWYNEWITTLRLIRLKTNNLTFDLTGGYDTRVVAALWLTANINLSNISINSKKNLVDDYKIASQIAKDFNIPLNNSISINRNYKEFNTTLDSSFYIKLGFHNQIYFKNFINDEIFYAFTGYAGECIRGYPYETTDHYLDLTARRVKKYSETLVHPSVNIIKRSFDRLSCDFNIPKEKNMN